MCFSLVSDPVLLSYRHGVEVSHSFQAKYFFNRSPLACMLTFILLVHTTKYRT